MKIPDIHHPGLQELSARSSQVQNQSNFADYLPGQPAAAPAAKAPASQPAASDAPRQTVISPEEQEYFANLFPAAAGEVRQYQTYSPAGTHPVTSSGSLIDRKG